MHPRRRTLLLVDHDLPRAERFRKRLSNLGYEVCLAENGAAGLLRVYEVHPQVVVAAGKLPVLDGFEMLAALRNKAPTRDLPVILLTESLDQQVTVRAWEGGADLCIPLGQGEADVLATLHRALEGVPATASTPGATSGGAASGAPAATPEPSLALLTVS